MTQKWARAALAHPAFTGVSRQHLGCLIEELAGPWSALREAALYARRGHKRLRAAGAGPKQELVFTDRVALTLVHLRTHLPHAAPAELYGVGRSTVSEAIGEIRPLLARRGFAVPDRPRLRLRTLADVFAYAEAEGVTLRINGMETQVRRPGAHRPGRMHDQTAMRTEGIAEQLRLHPGVKAEVDEGYRGLANEFPGQVNAPPKKPKDDAPDGQKRAWREMWRRQSSRRIVVEHANAEMRHWRPLQRYTGHRETYAETHRAIAGLVSDRAAQRATRPMHSTELVLARPAVC